MRIDKYTQVRGLPIRLACLLLSLTGDVGASSGSTSPAVSRDQTVNIEKLQELDVLSRFGIFPLDSLGATSNLDDYLGYAAAHNEELNAAIHAWQAIKDRRPQATSLPDPRFRFTEYLESVETRVGPQERAFGLSQTIPWFGKLSLKGQIEEERASGAAAGAKAVFLRIAYRVKKSYYDLAYLKHSLAITEEHLDLLSQWEEVARSRYATGTGSYAELIKAQVELGKLSERIEELRDRYRPLAAALNAALNRPADARIAWPTELEAQGSPLDEGALQRRLPVENPELLGLEHQALSFLRAEELAGKQRYPDLTLGVNYIQTGDARMENVLGSGKDPILASFSINIPIWSGKYQAAEREAAGSYLAAHSIRREKENNLAAALELALFGYRDALRKLDLYGDTLLPKGRQSLGATLAAYETGEAGFLDLVDAERLLLEFELSKARAAADLMIQLAEIEVLVGGPVFTVADKAVESLQQTK